MTTMTTETAMLIADAMVASDRESGDCTAEVLADPTATTCELWSNADIAAVARSLSRWDYVDDDRAAVEAAYARIWREAVEAEAADEVALYDIACDIAEMMLDADMPATELPTYVLSSDDEQYVRIALGGSASRSDLATVEAAIRAYQVARRASIYPRSTTLGGPG